MPDAPSTGRPQQQEQQQQAGSSASGYVRSDVAVMAKKLLKMPPKKV
jgi:hypothetical protein